MELENLQEKCGIFGCVATNPWPSDLETANIISMGLVGLQHRGQESAGIVTSTGEESLYHHRGMGLVNQLFDVETLTKLNGNLGIGHTRYSTVGASERTNCQPFIVESTYGQFAVAHNGELVNGSILKKKILQQGIGLSSGTDSEVITQILCQTPKCGEPYGVNWPSRIQHLMLQTQLAYSLVILSNDKIYAVRDPYGNRPLCLGYLCNQNRKSTASLTEENDLCKHIGYVISSESCVFGSIGAELYREVLPGEIVEVDRNGFKSCGIVPRHQGDPAFCIFEYIYFSRPDSFLEGQQVNAVRFRSGEQLARESSIEADVVSGVPESATAAALGFSKQSGIDYMEVLTRNRYVGRTFIQPSKHLRKIGVIKKFGFLQENFSGKRVILIDDSIVRGNTIAPLVCELKKFGAKEVHLRIASPPIKHPCYMGINIPTEDELIFNTFGSADILAKELGADSLQYLTVEGLHKAVLEGIKNKTPNNNIGHCNACLTGKYPVVPQFITRPYRLFKKVVDNCFLSINCPNVCSCQILNYKDVTIINKKKAKPKFIVWKGIRIIELAKSMNRNIDDVMEVICRVLGDETHLRYNTEINDISLLREVAKLCGGTIMEKVAVVKKVEEDKNVYRRNVFANKDRLKSRPPVVTIMGHVDHGKTTLLDSLRSSRIVDSEHGGITQHLSAFKVSLSDVSRKAENCQTGQVVTFLDTPGHAAFSSMRSRGANCTDIIVLVVAVEDGIMPQTIESIEFAKEAKVPIIVAVNKIDKIWKDLKHFASDKNKRALDPLKRNLANHDLVVEEYGGDVQIVPISAQKMWNIDLLQESILALAEVLNIRSDYEGLVESVVLEANVIENFGKVATVLVQHGCLKQGQILVAGNTYIKVRTITSDKGDFLKEAYPGDPVQVTGWKETLPSSGDIMIQVETESRAKEVLTYRKRKIAEIRSEADLIEYNRYMSEYKASYRSFINKGYEQGFRNRSERPQLVDFVSNKNIFDGVEIPQINIIIKADVHGSLEVLLEVLKKASKSCYNQCVLKVVHSGIGNITDTDIELAVSFNAIIYMFNLPKTTDKLEVDIRYFNVIYHLFDDLKEYLSSKLPESTEAEFVGEAEVLKTFDISERNKSISVSGCKCTSGVIYRNDSYMYKIIKPSFQSNEFEVLQENLVCRNLRHLKSDVESIRKGVECGLVLKNRQTGAIVTSDVGNVIQCYKINYVKQKLTWDTGF